MPTPIRDFDDYSLSPPPKPVFGPEIKLSAADEDRMILLASTPPGDPLTASLVKAASEGLVQVMRMSAKIGYDLVPALQISVEKNDVTAVKTLLASGAFDFDTKGFTLGFVTAAARNNVEIMALLKRGANYQVTRVQAGTAAGENGSSDAVFYLAKELEPTAVKTAEGLQNYTDTLKAAFQSAAKKGKTETAKLALRLINIPSANAGQPSNGR